jgi:hypothetical protein
MEKCSGSPSPFSSKVKLFKDSLLLLIEKLPQENFSIPKFKQGFFLNDQNSSVDCVDEFQ